MGSEFISNNISNKLITATNHTEVPPENYEIVFYTALSNVSLLRYEARHWNEKKKKKSFFSPEICNFPN
jgi:hypothetical protein